jgi:hypothetical protein
MGLRKRWDGVGYHSFEACRSCPASHAARSASAAWSSYVYAAEYWPERVKMMQAWADYLDRLREGGKVLPLPRRAKQKA